MARLVFTSTGPHCCVLLDDDSASASRRGESFAGLTMGLVTRHNGSITMATSSSGSHRSSLHSMPGWWDPDRVNGPVGVAGGGGGRRGSTTSSEVGPVCVVRSLGLWIVWCSFPFAECHRFWFEV